RTRPARPSSGDASECAAVLAPSAGRLRRRRERKAAAPTAALGPLTDIFLTEDQHGQRRRCPFLVSADSLTPPDPAFILEFRPCSRERVWARQDVARASRISCRGTARCSSVSAN